MSALITFTQADLDAVLQRQNPALVDSSSFTTRRTLAAKIALAQQMETYYQSGDPYITRDTFGLAGSIPVCGTAIFSNSVGEIFRIALPADGHRVMNNTIWVQNGTVLLPVPRLTIDTEEPFTGTGSITLGFVEVKGEILLYAATGLFTGTTQVHFYYQGFILVPAIGTDVIDILPSDFPAFVSAVQNFLSTD